MPAAIPFVAAAGSIATGLTVGGIAGGAMIAGGALTGLGAVTGNKKLQRVGAVLGVAGGVSAAFGVGTAASAANSSAAAGAAANQASQTASSLIASNASPTLLQTGGDAAVAEAVNAASPAATAAANTARAATTATTPASWWDSAKGALKTGGEWIEKNPNASKIGAGLIGGAAKTWSDQEAAKEEMQRAKDLRSWSQQRYSDSVRNLTIPNIFMPQMASGIIATSRG